MDVDRFVRRGQSIRPRRIICYNCKKEGHYARDCREKVDLRRFTMEELALALSNRAVPGEDDADAEDVGKDGSDSGNGPSASTDSFQ